MATRRDLLRHRLANQHITGAPLKGPEEVVRILGAVQAQEYASAKWAIAARTSGVTDAALDRLFDAGRILRTHVMRPTWHFVLPADIRWMLALTGPRVNTACGSRYRQLGLDDAFFARSNGVLARALRGGRALTRADLSGVLREAGLTSPRDDPQRLAHIVMRAELEAVICSGPRIGKQFSYALLDERVPHEKPLDRGEARSTLAERYFTSHGPATIQDFMWWSGLTAPDARLALDAVRSELVADEIGGRTYWRPRRQARAETRTPSAHLITTWDECFVAYRDRAATDAAGARATIVIDGRVAGAWRRAVVGDTVVVEATPFSPFSSREEDAVSAAAKRYGRFLGMPVGVSFRRAGQAGRGAR